LGITTTSAKSAIGYITPKDVLAGRQAEIHAREIGSWKTAPDSSAEDLWPQIAD
jgi:hypothetical protein